MEEIRETYQKLTCINIDEQIQLWDERGRGYYGEYLVFSELYPNIAGNCKILMNLQIPAANGRTTEIDLLLIHESGLYVFEIKHYKGTIYGKDSDQRWTQYFRTAPNSHFNSPIRQNQYHIQALKNIIPDLPINSIIVFTSRDCNLRINYNLSSTTVCQLFELPEKIKKINHSPYLLDADQIDSIFLRLLPFSTFRKEKVEVNGEPVPFYQFAETLRTDLQEETQKLKKQQISIISAAKKHLRTTLLIGMAVCIICICTSIIYCTNVKQSAETQIAEAYNQLHQMEMKFQSVDSNNYCLIEANDSLLTVSDVVLVNSEELANTTELSFTLTWNGNRYAARITEQTKINVILTDGSVQEFSLPDDLFPSSNKYIDFGNGNAWYRAKTIYQVPTLDLYGISEDQIVYIKLTNLNLTDITGSTPSVIGSGYEVEVFKAQ